MLLQENKEPHVDVPKSFCFWMKKESLHPETRNILEASSSAQAMDKLSEKEIAGSLRSFLSSGDNSIDALVIKPVHGSGGRNVIILEGEGEEPLHERAAREVSELRSMGKSVIVQERIRSPQYVNEEGKKTDCCFRVWVSPNENGEGMTWGSLARVGEIGAPVNISRDAKVMLTEDWIAGVREQNPHLSDELDTLEQKIYDTSRNAYDAVKKHVAKRHPPDSGQDALSLVGVDVMIRVSDDGKLTPVVIEINGHRSGAAIDLRQALQRPGTKPSLVEKYKNGSLPMLGYAAAVFRHIGRCWSKNKMRKGRSTSPGKASHSPTGAFLR